MADPLPLPSAVPTQELLHVAVAESHEPMLAPLIHLACTRCHADVWWPADLAADLRCPQCGGGLQPPEASPAAAPSPEPAGAPAHVVGLLRRLAEHHRRSADERHRDRAGAAPPLPEGVLLEQARAAHRLELLAAALDRLTVDDLEALRCLVDTPPVSAAEARQLRERARHAVAVLADLLSARDARV